MSALSAVSLGILSCFVNISRTQLKVAGKSAFPWVEKSLRIPALPSSSRCLSPWPEETAGCHGRWQARGHGAQRTSSAGNTGSRGPFRAVSASWPLGTLECGCSPVSGPQTGSSPRELPRRCLACCYSEFRAGCCRNTFAGFAQSVAGAVAQLVEQRPFKPWVPGSSPGRLTNPMRNQALRHSLR